MKANIYCFIVILMMFSMIACSSSNTMTPDNTFPTQSIDSMPLWVSESFPDGSSEGMGVMGLFSIVIKPQTLEAELLSLRTSLLEDVLEVVDITNFLQLAPCSDCAKLKNVKLNNDGNLVLSIGLKHPFDVGDPFKPITGRNRADLHVFNVEGIVISDGSGAIVFPSIGKTAGNFRLLNADGYTSYLDSSVDEIFPTVANIHPYITHFADYSQGNFNAGNPMGFESVTTPPPSGNLVMPMGSDYDYRDYVFSAINSGITFTYAVGCTYAVSAANKNLRFSPEYRVPQHNKKAASLVNVEILQNDLKGLDTSSTAQLSIQVLDINHGVAEGSALNEMRHDSSIASILVEVPGVTSSSISFSTTPISGDSRDPSNPLRFNGTITNSVGAIEGIYKGIVKVLDSYATGLNESPLLNGMDGIKRVEPIANPLTGLYSLSEFATYQIFEIEVLLGNEDPIAILRPNPANGCDGAPLWFNASNSYDPDGSIVLYEFDFDLEGGNIANFNPDVSGTSARVQSSIYYIGTYYAALRVTDDFSAQDTDIVQVNISVSDNFDVSPYDKYYATDTNFSNVIFAPNGYLLPREWNNIPRPFGMEAMATGSEYIYAIFYAQRSTGNGLYIARSGDDGETWGDYQLIHPFATSSDFRGAAICAVDSEVFITTHAYNTSKYWLYYNNNHGEGAFTQRLLLDSPPEHPSIGEPSIAVDPNDSNKIYACFAQYPFASTSHSDQAYVLTSTTGPTGTFTKSAPLYPAWLSTYYAQVWSTECKAASNGYVYVIQVANHTISTHRTVDSGTTWGKMSDVYITTFSRHADYCISPSNADTIYLLVNRRYYNSYQYYRTTNGGANWSTISSNLQVGSDTAYSNPAICTDRTGNIYAVFTDVSSGNPDVYGRYSNNGGTSFGSAFQISDHPGNDTEVEITTSLNGCDVVIGWLEDFGGTQRIVTRKG